MKVKLIVFACLLAVGCSKSSPLDNLSSCTELATTYGNDISVFSANPTKANCEKVVSSLKNYIDKCNFLNNAAISKAELEKELKEINCSDF